LGRKWAKDLALPQSKLDQSVALIGYKSKKPGDAGVIDEGRAMMRRQALNKEASASIQSAIASPGKMTVKYVSGPSVRASVTDWLRMIGGDPAHGKTVTIGGLSKKETGKYYSRSYYRDSDRSIHLHTDCPEIVWHELGHMLEHMTPGGEDAAHSYLKTRSHGAVQALDTLDHSHPGYESHEQACRGDFPDVYLGKRYQDGATEVTSMAMQYLKEDPGKLWQRKELLYFLLGMIKASRDGGFPWAT
jgi:hypothetical protein